MYLYSLFIHKIIYLGRPKHTLNLKKKEIHSPVDKKKKRQVLAVQMY